MMKNQVKSGLSARQANILAAIVKEYSDKGEPVASQEINDKYHLGVSPATVRSEMSALEKMGYIEQPHTSAGRIPTDTGYRYFVKELMKRFELSLREQKFLHQELQKLQKQNLEISRSITKLLAQKTDQAAFALLPDDTHSSGLANILAQPNIDKKEAVEVAEFFENIEDYGDKIMAKYFPENSETLIGRDAKIPQMANYSMIVSKVNLPSGKSGVIGIVGPKSMRYDKNISLVEYVAKLISSGLLIALIINIR